ncbi:MAG TPA: hypothetical protein VGD07_11285, partial [Methylomirabilota bacterium]
GLPGSFPGEVTIRAASVVCIPLVPGTASALRPRPTCGGRRRRRAGVEIDTPDQAKPYLDMGVKHFCMGWDVGILFDWFKGNGAKLRAMMGA